jgi:RNA polymerase II subunit A small phosphatase-like protein
MNIISIFFFDSYRLINNYDFNDLFNFFNIFISKENNNQYNNNNNNTINYPIGGKTSSTNELKVVNKPNFFLPPINKKYKYTLILDLDETLIYLKNKINISNNDKFLNNPFSSSILILRPGLIDFLKKMKQIYELIIFSSGTLEYIMPIIKIIEKKGKFFEYILYRKHISFLKNGEYYKDLSLLNRNLKNVIIVDDMA